MRTFHASHAQARRAPGRGGSSSAACAARRPCAQPGCVSDPPPSQAQPAAAAPSPRRPARHACAAPRPASAPVGGQMCQNRHQAKTGCDKLWQPPQCCSSHLISEHIAAGSGSERHSMHSASRAALPSVLVARCMRSCKSAGKPHLDGHSRALHAQIAPPRLPRAHGRLQRHCRRRARCMPARVEALYPQCRPPACTHKPRPHHIAEMTET